MPESMPEPQPPLDSDNDGVIDELDDCQGTRKHLIVGKDGCAVFDGIVEGIEFNKNSAQLTSAARIILDGVASTLKDFPQAQVSIAAHTDSWGADDYNQTLSERRADAVVNYLVSRALQRSRFSSEAFGESAPIQSNKTAAGRAKNRRVEIVASNGVAK